MDDSRSKAQVLILDCCHSGAFRQGITKATLGQPVQTGMIFEGAGRVVLAASDATQFALEGDKLVGEGALSIFTHYLVEGLDGLRADANHDGMITVDELYEYVYTRVTAHTPTQTPVKWNYKQRGAFVIAGSGELVAHPNSVATGLGSSKPFTYRTWVVDQMHRGDFLTISEAITAANAGDKIVIRPGTYDGGLVINKPLEIEGEGDISAIIIQATGKHTLIFAATVGQLRNLTLRQNGGRKWHCVDIAQGRLLLEGCDIRSQSQACIEIQDGAAPTIRNNRIHDSKADGICVSWQGQVVIEGNDIFANTGSGISIAGLGNPTVRNNRIYDNKSSGIIVFVYGQGLIEENQIFANAHSGIVVANGANPKVCNNRIHDGKQSGIIVLEQGKGLIEENEIFANAYSGIIVTSGGNPKVRNNRIYENAYKAIQVYGQGGGRFEKNDLCNNRHGAWDIADDCLPNVTRKGNIEK